MALVGGEHWLELISANSRSTSRSAGPALPSSSFLACWDCSTPGTSRWRSSPSATAASRSTTAAPATATSRRAAIRPRLIARDVIGLMDKLGIDKAHMAGTSTGGCVLQNLAIDHPGRLRCCIFSNTWVKADEYITRVQMTRKRIALSYGPEEYVKVSSLFTNGAMQFRYDLDKVMELERRALATVAPVDVLAQRLDMTLTHDRIGELSRIRQPVAHRRHARRCHRALLSVGGPAQGHRRLPPGHRRGRRPLFLSPPLAGVEQDGRRLPDGDRRQRLVSADVGA